MKDDIHNDPFDTEYTDDAAYERERARIRRVRILLLAFALLMAGAVSGAYFLRENTLVPAWALVTPGPTATVAPTPDATPEQTPDSAAVSQSTAPAEGGDFCATSVYIDGELFGTLASREAAEELISEVQQHFELAVDAPGIPYTYIENAVSLQDATQDEAHETVPYETLYAILTGEASPLRVITELTSQNYTNVSCETITEESKYLLKGTRLIVRMGRDGSTHTAAKTYYLNGVAQGEPVTSSAEAVTRIDGEILLGTQKLDKNAEPGKREGQKGPDKGELTFIHPHAKKRISLNFGQYKGTLHLGLDYTAEEADEVLASCAGTVVCAMERGGYGLIVEIDHGDGFVTRYAHLSQISVSLGDTVAQGDVIALAGATGDCEGPVLHFELRIDGIAYNPRFYLE